MSNISYIRCSEFYTGNTNSYNYTYTDGGDDIIRSGETSILFIVTTDTSGSIVKPKDWETITSIGNSASYMYSFWYQPSANTSSSPSWTFELTNNPVTMGFSIILTGCTKNSSKLIHKYTQSSNPSSQKYTNGFTTTMNNTAIIHAVSIVSGVTTIVQDFSSTPSTTWQDILSGTKLSGSTYLHMSVGLSERTPAQTYSQFAFNYNPDTNSPNLTNVVSLFPNIKTNQVLNLLQSFRAGSYFPEP